MSVSRRRLASGVVAGAVLALASGVSAAPAARSACQRLAGHDLAPARSVKLVQRRHKLATELVACSLPHGRVRQIASGSSSGSLFSEDVRLLQVAGAYAALTTTFGDQYALGDSTLVVNLRTGKERTIASSLQDTGTAPQPGATRAVAVIVTAGGRGAAAVTEVAGGAVRILAFGSRGAPVVLDAGPPADVPATSLALTGATIAWTHTGAPRSAPLPSDGQ
jgi:hypothetical protein